MSVSLQPQGSAHELMLSAQKELALVLEAMDRLRASAITNLSEDHPCTLEIEDFAWHTRQFSEGLTQKLAEA